MGRNTFYKTNTAAASPTWTEVNLGGSMTGIHIINRGAVALEFSFNGSDIDGRITPTDGAETRDSIDESKIFLRGDGATCDYQIEAWRGKP